MQVMLQGTTGTIPGMKHLRQQQGPMLRFSRRRHDEHAKGQTLVEFALVIPPFMAMLIGIIEFSLMFNALLSINFATREAALIGAEAGNANGADCVILRTIENSVGAPSSSARLTEIRIFRSDQNGNLIGSAVNVYDRSGSTMCTYADGTVETVPYRVVGAPGYPSTARCNVLDGCGGTQTTVDQIGVRATYDYTWHTPLSALLSLTGTGYTLVQSSAMRMEPIL